MSNFFDDNGDLCFQFEKAGILLEQARAFPERRELLVRWLERAEVRASALTREITTTGGRLLASLADEQAEAAG